MAKMECHFFTGSPAAWICNKCNTCYGKQCIPAGHSHHWGRLTPPCIRCNTPLRYLGSATDAKPFWQMLPHFFLYPLQSNSLLVMGFVTALSLLFTAGLLGLAATLLALATVVKYGFVIIERRGAGDTVAPTLGDALTGDAHHLFLRQFALLFLMWLAVVGSMRLHPTLGMMTSFFIALAIPASTMLLAITKSVRESANPLGWLSLMLAVGWPYLLLWLCTQVITAGPDYILEWTASALPDVAIMPSVTLLMTYFSLVLYTMLGYVLFEYQHELGYETAPDEDDDDMDHQSFTKARALGETAVYISDGDYQLARTCLRQALDSVRDDLDLHLQYHKLLMLLDDDQALVNHSNYVIGLLKTQNQLPRAVNIVRDTQTRVPGFTPADTRVAIDIARLMVMQGLYRPAVKLFHNHHKRRPDDPLLPEAYWLVAQVMSEHLNEDTQAKAIARFMLKKYPRCPQHADFARLAGSQTAAV